MFRRILVVGIAIAAVGALHDLVAVFGTSFLNGFDRFILMVELRGPVVLFLLMADGALVDGPAFGLTGVGVHLDFFPGMVVGSGDGLGIGKSAGTSESFYAGIGASGRRCDGAGVGVLMLLFLTGSEHESGGSEEEQRDQSNDQLKELSG